MSTRHKYMLPPAFLKKSYSTAYTYTSYPNTTSVIPWAIDNENNANNNAPAGDIVRPDYAPGVYR